MCEHGDELGYGYEHVEQEHKSYHMFPYGFPFPHHMYEYRGYRLPLTKEGELELLEEWKTKMEEWKTKMDNKLARIEQRIEELKKGGAR